MTARSVLPVREPGKGYSLAAELTDDQRRNAIRWLADRSEEMPPSAVTVLLAAWAHPSLSPERQAALFAEWRDCTETAAALRDGVADVGVEMPELTCDEPWFEAARQLEDRAAKALCELVNGQAP